VTRAIVAGPATQLEAVAAQLRLDGFEVVMIDDDQTGADEGMSPASLSLLADVAPELGYTDWRDEIMSAVCAGTPRSYLGWTTADGRRRAVVLSGSVLSPLPEPPGGSPSLSWGEAGPGAVALAEGILADAFRGPELPAQLSEAFAQEILMRLPADGFELSAAEVAGWGRERLGGVERELVTAGSAAVG
jgi:hypothetical protein